LSRVINPEGVGKLRNQLCRHIIMAIRSLMQQSDLTKDSKDIAAFVGISLLEIYKTIDVTVTPWEKRGYWVKADRFRLEWEWTERYAKNLYKALLKDDWGEIASLFVNIGTHLKNVKPPVRIKNIEYNGSWKRLSSIIESDI